MHTLVLGPVRVRSEGEHALHDDTAVVPRIQFTGQVVSTENRGATVARTVDGATLPELYDEYAGIVRVQSRNQVVSSHGSISGR